MHPSLQARLVERHSVLFAGTRLTPSESSMAWGFAVSDGWFPIVETVSDLIASRCPDAVALQVKQKFGTLRFYLRGGDDWCRGAIYMAEAMSALVCERTGRPGVTISLSGYVTTIAPDATPEEAGERTAGAMEAWRAAGSKPASETHPGPRWPELEAEIAAEEAEMNRLMAGVRIDVPYGWKPLAGELASLLCRRDTRGNGIAAHLRAVVRGPDGEMEVDAERLNEFFEGAVACAAALAARTDTVTGAMPIEPAPGI